MTDPRVPPALTRWARGGVKSEAVGRRAQARRQGSVGRRARQPGQFVIVRLGPGAERIPLTIAESDPAAGTIVLVIQAVGKSTSDLVALVPGDHIHDIVGPLGRPSDLVAEGTACASPAASARR